MSQLELTSFTTTSIAANLSSKNGRLRELKSLLFGYNSSFTDHLTSERTNSQVEAKKTRKIRKTSRLNARNLLALTILLTTYAPSASASFAPYPMDRGGLIIDYLLQNSNPQRIVGTCMSACTLKLGAQRVCVVAGTPQSPLTILWFHAPSGWDAENSGRWLMKVTYAKFSRVAAWVRSRRVLETKHFTEANTLTGWQLVRMGVPRCKS